MVMRSPRAQEAERARLERAGARRRHGDELERALHRLERIGLLVRRQLFGESEQQLLGSAAAGDEADAGLDEPHVQLGVRLHAVGVQRELAAAAEREAERRGDDGERRAPDRHHAVLEAVRRIASMSSHAPAATRK